MFIEHLLLLPTAPATGPVGTELSLSLSSYGKNDALSAGKQEGGFLLLAAGRV